LDIPSTTKDESEDAIGIRTNDYLKEKEKEE